MAHPNHPNRAVTLVKLLGVLAVTGVLAAGVLLPVIGGVGLTGKAEANRFLNTTCQLDETAPTTKTTIYASDGQTPIASLFAQNRTPVKLAQIPVPMQKALVDTEDRRFYSHHGVDIRGLLRAAVNNGESGNTQGGSTLTMQYVKQLRYYNAKSDVERAAAIDQTVDRKIQDAKCALDLEKRQSKAQILEDYFNIAFFGENSYGVESAAATYFNKDVSQLTVPEAALIAGLVQAPTQYDPFTDAKAATDRRNVVIQNMVTAGDLSAADGAAAQKAPLGLAATTPPPVAEGCAYYNTAVPNAGFFCDWAVAWLNAHGFSTADLQKGGLKIVTTLDAALQTQGQQAVWSGDPGQRGGAFSPTSPSTLVMPSVDPKTGNVTTMITSRLYGLNQNDPNQTAVPIFTTPAAGAGSTYKYFTTVTALQSGASPTLTLNAGDPYTAKYCPKDTDPQTGRDTAYVAHNAGSYAAVLPMDKALYESSNTYFVGLEDMYFGCYTKPISDMAVNLGMNALTLTQLPNGVSNVPNDYEATFTLGQHSTSPLELTSAYATAANDGVYCPPNAVLSVTDSTGKDVPVKRDGCAQKYDPQIARTILQMLVKDTNTSGGTATSQFSSWYRNGGSQVASKTGTNNATDPNTGKDNGKNSAIWFVGLTPSLVSAATVFDFKSPTSTISGLPGFSDGYAAGDAFGAAAGAYWLKAFGPALADHPWSWASPDDVPGVPVPNVTGKSPADATAALSAAGFKANVLSYQCGSAQRAGTISGYSPTKAQPGATVTACISNGRAPSSSAPVAPAPTRRPAAPAPAPAAPAPAPAAPAPAPAAPAPPAVATDVNGGQPAQ